MTETYILGAKDFMEPLGKDPRQSLLLQPRLNSQKDFRRLYKLALGIIIRLSSIKMESSIHVDSVKQVKLAMETMIKFYHQR